MSGSSKSRVSLALLVLVFSSLAFAWDWGNAFGGSWGVTGMITATASPPVACLDLACLYLCPYGYAADANGCQTCDCNPAPNATATPTVTAIPTPTPTPSASCSVINAYSGTGSIYDYLVVKGSCSDSKGVFSDNCSQSYTGDAVVNEYYCSVAGTCLQNSYNCRYVYGSTGQCSNGACVPGDNPYCGKSGQSCCANSVTPCASGLNCNYGTCTGSATTPTPTAFPTVTVFPTPVPATCISESFLFEGGSVSTTSGVKVRLVSISPYTYNGSRKAAFEVSSPAGLVTQTIGEGSSATVLGVTITLRKIGAGVNNQYYVDISVCYSGGPLVWCADSDGENYYSKGYAKGTDYYGKDLSGYDYCDGSTLNEYICKETYGFKHVTKSGIVCPSGYYCKDGACAKASGSTCSDSDGGKAYHVQGTAVSGTLKKSDYCDEYGQLMEYYCGSQYGEQLDEIYVQIPAPRCEYGCKDGACVKATPTVTVVPGCEVGGYRCEKDSAGKYTGWAQKCYDSSAGWVNVQYCDYGCDGLTGQCKPKSVLAYCKDSDGGISEFVYGHVYGMSSNGVAFREQDICYPDGTTLKEKYCRDGTYYDATLVSCANGCKDGACIGRPTPTPSAEFKISSLWSEPYADGVTLVLAKIVDSDGTPSTPEEGTNASAIVYFANGSGVLQASRELVYDGSRAYYLLKVENRKEAKAIVSAKASKAGQAAYAKETVVLYGSATPSPCPLLRCAVYCEYGEELDSRGCPSCKCKPSPTATIVPGEDYKLRLLAGWNLFSVPLERATISYTDCSAATVWHYDSAGNKYVKSGSLSTGVYLASKLGYWAKVPAACTVLFQGVSKASMDGYKLLPGWNQIGAGYEKAAWSALSSECKATAGPYSYDSAAKAYEKAAALYPGEGYFVKVQSACALGQSDELPPVLPE